MESTAHTATSDHTAAGLRRRLQPWQRQLAWQVGIVLAGAAGYAIVNSIIQALFPAGEQRRLAVENGQRVVEFERALHLFGEHEIYSFTNGNGLLKFLSNAAYMGLHIPLIMALAVWLYVRRRDLYDWTRNAMLVSGAIALLCEFFPVAPPYMIPGLNVVNTAAGRVYDVVEPKTFFDEYGAVPSIHVAWSLMLALALFLAVRSPWLRAFAVALPVLMSIAVISTGNHYVFDVLTGVLAAAIGLGAGWLLPRARRLPQTGEPPL